MSSHCVPPHLSLLWEVSQPSGADFEWRGRGSSVACIEVYCTSGAAEFDTGAIIFFSSGPALLPCLFHLQVRQQQLTIPVLGESKENKHCRGNKQRETGIISFNSCSHLKGHFPRQQGIALLCFSHFFLASDYYVPSVLKVLWLSWAVHAY